MLVLRVAPTTKIFWQWRVSWRDFADWKKTHAWEANRLCGDAKGVCHLDRDAKLGYRPSWGVLITQSCKSSGQVGKFWGWLSDVWWWRSFE